MTKGKKRLIGFLVLCSVLLVSCGGYLYQTRTPEVPKIREELDTTLTENKFYLSEENFKQTMEQEIEPYLAQYLEEGYVENEGIELHYKKYQTGTAKKAIVISHGFTENSEKYNEPIYYFVKAGFDVYIMEHRGHGYSTREVEDYSLVHVESFDDYQSDFKKFMDEVVVPTNGDQPLYAFAHSMGGNIMARFLEDCPEYFDAAILSSPMMQIKTGGVPEPIVSMVSMSAKLIGKGTSYVFGYGPYVEQYNYEESSVKSEARYEYCYSKEIADERYKGNAPTFSWAGAAMKQTRRILKEENLAKIQVPVLLFQAEEDHLVGDAGLYKFANGVSNVTFKYAKDSRHQIFTSENKVMIPYYNTVFAFLESLEK